MRYFSFRILRPAGIGNVLEVEREGVVDIPNGDVYDVVKEIRKQWYIGAHYVLELKLPNDTAYVPFAYAADGREVMPGGVVRQ